jgi:hypothetical protein
MVVVVVVVEVCLAMNLFASPPQSLARPTGHWTRTLTIGDWTRPMGHWTIWKHQGLLLSLSRACQM